MSEIGQFALRAIVFCVLLGLYKLLRHPDTPTFILGLSRMTFRCGQRGLQEARGRYTTFPNRLRPELTPDLKKLLLCLLTLLLVAAFGDWGHNFYVLVRFITTIISVLLLLRIYPRQAMFWSVVIGSVAILYNPFAPLHFDRSTWVVLNCITAAVVLLFLSMSKGSLSKRLLITESEGENNDL
jgi:hypothetical protein